MSVTSEYRRYLASVHAGLERIDDADADLVAVLARARDAVDASGLSRSAERVLAALAQTDAFANVRDPELLESCDRLMKICTIILGR